MTRNASAALMPLAEARTLLLGTARPAAPESVPLTEALGLIAAAAVHAPFDLPMEATALRDGYAVASILVGGASPYAPVRLPGSPAWIEAGQTLPQGLDAVLAPEGLEGRDAVAEVFSREGVRVPGEDFSKGDTLIAAGERIEPRHLPALAAFGLVSVDVRRPRIALLATGASRVDALTPFLAAQLVREGAGTATAAAPDEAEAIAAAIRAVEADAVLVLGGTGFGRTDCSAAGLAGAGRLLAHGIALRPGETAGLGEAAGRPVLLVPGRPEAALAVFLTLGRPLVAALSGAKSPVAIPAILTKKIASGIGLSEVLLGRRVAHSFEPLGGADLSLRCLVEADAAVLVPPEREGYPDGTEVEVWDL